MEGINPASYDGAPQDESRTSPLTLEDSDYMYPSLTPGSSGGTAETGFAISSYGSQAVSIPNQGNQHQLGLGVMAAIPSTGQQSDLVPHQSNQMHLIFGGITAIPSTPTEVVLEPNQCNQNKLAMGEAAENICAVSSSRQQAVIPYQNESKREIDKNDRKRKPIAAIPDQNERKRKSDKDYRQRVKENNERVKQERDELHEENNKLLDEKNKLLEELHSLRAEKEMEKMKQNDVKQQFRMELEVIFPSENAMAKAMQMIAVCPGITAFSLDKKNKSLTLKGEMDSLELQQELKKICEAKLLSFSLDTINEEKEEEKKVYMRPNEYPSMSSNGYSAMSTR